MGLTFLGPSETLTLGDGTVVKPGDAVTLDDATRAALEGAGMRFADSDAPADAPADPPADAPKAPAPTTKKE